MGRLSLLLRRWAHSHRLPEPKDPTRSACVAANCAQTIITMTQ